LEEACRLRAEFTEEQLRPAPLLTGDDLIELGFAPGPLFKQILDAVEEQQLEGALDSREDALRFLQQNFDRAG
jgi:poly(A) polymerase